MKKISLKFFISKIILIIGISLFIFNIKAFADFTVVVLPDTQRLSHGGPNFKKLTKWIVNNKKELDIRFVISLGDMVDKDGTKDIQWRNCKAAIDLLTDAEIPFVPCQGNHDNKKINTYFRVKDFKSRRWSGFRKSIDGKSIECSYWEFEAEKNKFIVVNTGDQKYDEHSKQKKTAFATKAFNDHPEHIGIYVTHGSGSIKKKKYLTDYRVTEILRHCDNVLMTVYGHHGNIGSFYWQVKSYKEKNTQWGFMTAYTKGNNGRLKKEWSESWDLYKRNKWRAVVRLYIFRTKQNKVEVRTVDVTEFSYFKSDKINPPNGWTFDCKLKEE